jgi:predicted nuclease with TOPRIM domain
LGELEKKVANCDQIIQNYENPGKLFLFIVGEGLSIHDIIDQLKDERSRLNHEITRQKEVISDLDEEIRELEESIKILDFKNTIPKK